MPAPIVDERSFRTEVLQSELPVLLELFSERATQASKAVSADVEALSNELAGKAKVLRVSIEKSPTLARELRIQQAPTFMVIARGRVVDAQAGMLSRAQLRAMIEPHLPRAEGSILPAELARVLPTGQAVPVDIREAAVFARAHLPGAVNLPEDEIENRLAELHMLAGEPVLYCRSGDKSKALAQKLAEQGMPLAFLEGGVLGWEAEGFKLERP